MKRVVHLPVLVPGWIKIDPDDGYGTRESPVALHVEVAPDEAVLDESRTAFWDSDGDGDGPNLDPATAQSFVDALSNESFGEVPHAELYT